jgi:hypothetical protein
MLGFVMLSVVMPLMDAAAYFAIDVTYTCIRKKHINYNIGAMTLSIMTFRIMTLSIAMPNITIHSI